MNEFFESLAGIFKNRAKSSLYGTLILAWLISNWQSFYTTIFVDQEIIFNLYGVLKIEYIWEVFYGWCHFATYWKLFLEPLLITYLAIWQIPKIELVCARKSRRNEMTQKIELLKEDQVFLEAERDLEIKKEKILENKIANLEKEKTIEITEEKKWDADYKKLEQKDGFLNTLETLKECVYLYDGNIWQMRNRGNNELTPQRMAFLESNDLIKKSGDIITLTEKGKFFLKNLFEEEDSKI